MGRSRVEVTGDMVLAALTDAKFNKLQAWPQSMDDIARNMAAAAGREVDRHDQTAMWYSPVKLRTLLDSMAEQEVIMRRTGEVLAEETGTDYLLRPSAVYYMTHSVYASMVEDGHRRVAAGQLKKAREWALEELASRHPEEFRQLLASWASEHSGVLGHDVFTKLAELVGQLRELEEGKSDG